MTKLKILAIVAVVLSAIIAGSVIVSADPGAYDLNGKTLILDADGDSSLSAAVDDTVLIKAGGSTIVTVTASGVVISSLSPTALTVTDTGFTIQDDATPTKQLQFQLSSISGATTRTLTIQDVSGTVYVTGGTDVTVADGGTNCSVASITCFNNITGFTAAGTTGTTSTNLVFSESPTFTGTVVIPTPFTLGATSVTSTGTQLNYLSGATGTTGTTTTNLVFSTSPTLVTPILGAAKYSSLESVTLASPTDFNVLTHIFNGASLFGSQASVGGETDLCWNCYYFGGWKYRIADLSNRISFNGFAAGATSFAHAVAGSADGAITWVEDFRISPSGITLGVGGGSGANITIAGDTQVTLNAGGATRLTLAAGQSTFSYARNSNSIALTNTTDSQTMLWYPNGAASFCFYYGSCLAQFSSGAVSLENNTLNNVGCAQGDFTSSSAGVCGSIQIGIGTSGATQTVYAAATSGTDQNGNHIVIQGGQATGSGTGGNVSLYPSLTGSGSGTTSRGASSNGFSAIFGCYGVANNSVYNQINYVFGTVAQVNRGGVCTGGSSVVTIDGSDNGVGNTTLEIVGADNNSGATQGKIDFYGSSSKNHYARIGSATQGATYTSGTLYGQIRSTGTLYTGFEVTGTGQIYFPNHSTTASAANAFLDSGSGQLLRSTSSLQFKTDIQYISFDEAINLVEQFKGFSYKSTIPTDDQTRRFLGFGAEDVNKVDSRLVNFDINGEPDGLQYERFTVLHNVVLNSHEERIKGLELQIVQLSAQLNELSKQLKEK